MYNLKTINNYAKMSDCTTANIYKKLKNKKLVAIEIDGVKFIDITESPLENSLIEVNHKEIIFPELKDYSEFENILKNRLLEIKSEKEKLLLETNEINALLNLYKKRKNGR